MQVLIIIVIEKEVQLTEECTSDHVKWRQLL